MVSDLRIVHVLEKNRLTTGSVVQMLDAAVGLASRGHRVTVVSRPGGDLEAACGEARIRFVGLPLRRADLRSVLALRHLLRSQRVEVVHAHKGRAHALALVAAAGLGPRPVVVVNRGVTFPLDALNRLKYRHPRVGAVVCVAASVREEVIRSGRLAPERVHTVYAGSDTRRFDPRAVDGDPVRRELGLERGQPLIGQVSVRDWKGWRQLLNAFASLQPSFPAARVLLVGCEPESERLRVLGAAAGLGVGEAVLTLPYRRDMPHVLAACDVVADASFAGTGITGTVREAMAMERAVVVTDCGGNRELVASDEVGLVVSAGNVPALAAALVRLLAEPDLRERMGRAARARVEERFSTVVRVDRLEALYRRLLVGKLAPQEGFEPPT